MLFCSATHSSIYVPTSSQSASVPHPWLLSAFCKSCLIWYLVGPEQFSFPRIDLPRQGRHLKCPQEHPKNVGAKKPQLSDDQPQVVAGAAQDCMYCIAERTLEPVSSELAVRFHVTNGRLNGTAPLDHRF